MALKLFADNVLIVLEPLDAVSKGGIHLTHLKKSDARGSRWALVLAAGPGYHKPSGAFVPTEVKPGDRVLVDALAGENQDYRLDFYTPRHNRGTVFNDDLGGDTQGEKRIVRHDEILCIEENQEAA